MGTNSRKKLIILISLLITVVGIGVAFAAFSTNLFITGSADIQASKWDIKFKNLDSMVYITGSGQATDSPTIADTTTPTATVATVLQNCKANFSPAHANGTVAWMVTMANEGTIPAKIASITVDSPTFTGTGTTAQADEITATNAFSTSLTYAPPSNADLAVGQILNPGEEKEIKFTMQCNRTATIDNLVKVSNVNVTINWVEANS